MAGCAGGWHHGLMPLHGEYAPEVSGWVAGQLAKIDETGTTDSVDIMGLPVVVVTMRGAKSGLLRRVPLMRVEHDGVYAAVASKGGAKNDPVWASNLRADPHVEVQDGTTHGDFIARAATPEEHAQWWPRAVAAFPPYAEYQTKTDRQIPVFLLEPVTG